MDPSVTTRKVPTRRECLKGGSALFGGGLLAGCLGGSDGSTPADDGDQSYEATMSPVGTVEFTEPPTNVMVYNLLYADMAVAYGYGDAINSLGFSTEVGKALDSFYDRLDGVSFEREGLTQLNTGSGGISVDIELFYDLDSDLHLVDPALVVSFDGWNSDDIEEITEYIAPFFGNNYSRRHTEPPEPYRDGYEYYTLWEISEKVAEVFQAQQRYEALASIHDDLIDEIQSNLPPEEERPTVGSVIYMDETFYPAKINTPGFANAHTRPLGATDAFAEGDVSYESAYDFETMLEVDPDYILHRYGYSYYDITAIRDELADHQVGQQLSAVENDRVYTGGNPLQGPVMNLFQLEMTAKQLYPEQFGEWPTYTGGPYPDIPDDEQLFDRQRVADIITGSSQ